MNIFMIVFLKEMLSFLRSAMLVLLILYSFTIDIYIAGSGIQVTPRNVAVGYVDYGTGGLGQKILSRLHQPEFAPPIRFNSQQALSKAVFNKEIIVGIIFSPTFEKSYRQGKKAKIDLLLDATAASQSLTTLSYLQNIILSFEKPHFAISLKLHKLFNQNSDEHSFMALSELLSIVTMLSIILTAVVFVREKEEGTWDILLLMPVNPKLIILAKTLSQVAIVMIGVIISLGLVMFTAFDAPMNGSLWIFILLTFLFAFSSSGLGLFIAAISKNTMQVAQLSIIIMMPLVFLSGAWTPIYAMNPILQKISLLSPLRYYIEGSESIFFRGTPFVELWPYFLGVSLLGAILYAIGFNKIGKLF
jgi:ABC-2 type transport system permease protein